MVQFYNLGGLRCAAVGQTTEDGYVAGVSGEMDCERHDGDYADPAWGIALGEVLRLVQFFNDGGLPCVPGCRPADGGWLLRGALIPALGPFGFGFFSAVMYRR